MNREEQVRLTIVGALGSFLERNECVVRARINNFTPQPFLNQRAQPLRYVQHEVFLVQSGRPVRSHIMAPMAGVENHAPEFQTQRAYERTVAVHVALGRQSVGQKRRLRGLWRRWRRSNLAPQRSWDRGRANIFRESREGGRRDRLEHGWR